MSFRFFSILILSLFSAGQALADNECRECKGPYGLTYYNWGESCPSGTQQTATLPMKSCGIASVGALNDPFAACNTNGTNHKVWIGGNNNDLLIIGVGDQTAQEGAFYRIQDGKDYVCGEDVVSQGHFTMLRYGVHKDLMDIFVVRPDNSISRSTYRLQDGRHHGIVVGPTWIGRLYGNHKDIVAAYWVPTDGPVVTGAFSFFDGRDHILERVPDQSNAFGIRYGNNDDVRSMICFKNNQWSVRGLGINVSYPNSC